LGGSTLPPTSPRGSATTLGHDRPHPRRGESVITVPGSFSAKRGVERRALQRFTLVVPGTSVGFEAIQGWANQYMPATLLRESSEVWIRSTTVAAGRGEPSYVLIRVDGGYNVINTEIKAPGSGTPRAVST